MHLMHVLFTRQSWRRLRTRRSQCRNVGSRAPGFKSKFEKDTGQTIDESQVNAVQWFAVAEFVCQNCERIVDRTRSLEGRLTLWAGINGLLFNIGAFFGIYSFSKVTHIMGRKPTFAITFVLALTSTAFAFWNLSEFNHIFWMVPLMGFCQIALFGGYAIYFPELFPTRLRSTGTSFCYNVGRYVAAPGPLVLGARSMAWFLWRRDELAPRGGDDVRLLLNRLGRAAVRTGDQG